jgi:hypothetical protein
MRIKLNIVASDAASNMNLTLQHTGIVYPTRTLVFTREVEIPDLPHGYAVDSITLAGEEDEE